MYCTNQQDNNSNGNWHEHNALILIRTPLLSAYPQGTNHLNTKKKKMPLVDTWLHAHALRPHRCQENLVTVPLHLQKLRLGGLRGPPRPRDGPPAEKTRSLLEGVQDHVPTPTQEVAQAVHHLEDALQRTLTIVLTTQEKGEGRFICIRGAFFSKV